jgi:hypothetical protein
MRKYILIALLLLLPSVLMAQNKDKKERDTKVEYVVSFGSNYAFSLPYEYLGMDSCPAHRYEANHGYNIAFDARAIVNDNLYLGGEFSMTHLYMGELDDWRVAPHWVLFNFAPNVKGVLPLNNDCSLFANASVGTTGVMMVHWCLYLKGAVGMEYGRFVAEVGYRGYGHHGMSIGAKHFRMANTIYLQLGVRLGKLN